MTPLTDQRTIPTTRMTAPPSSRVSPQETERTFHRVAVLLEHPDALV